MSKAGQRVNLGEVRSFLGKRYGPDLRAERIGSPAGATLGVMAAASLAAAMIGQALVAMDWTDFDQDGRFTLMLSLVTGHGRAAPLL